MSDSNLPPDPLSSGILCRRDIPYLTDFNINVVLVESIDRDKDHSECMNALADAGIYVVADVMGIGAGYMWNQEKPDYKIGIISSLANYSNLLGLRMFAGGQQPTNMLYFRAAFRDMRAYMSKVLHMKIPIILAVVPETPDRAIIDYMWCHNDTADVIHLWIGGSVINCTTTQNIEDAVDFVTTWNTPIILEGMRCDLYRDDPDDRNYEFMYDVYSGQGAAALSGGILERYYGRWSENWTYG